MNSPTKKEIFDLRRTYPEAIKEAASQAPTQAIRQMFSNDPAENSLPVANSSFDESAFGELQSPISTAKDYVATPQEANPTRLQKIKKRIGAIGLRFFRNT